MTGPGRVGSRVTHRLQNVGRVGLGPEKVTRVHLCATGGAAPSEAVKAV